VPDIGDRIVIHAEFGNRYGVPTNPLTVTGWVQDPTGTNTPVVFSNPETGIFEATFLIAVAGTHWARVDGIGNGITASRERKFKVKARVVNLV